MALSTQHITVSFPGVKALDDVDIELKDGRVHALLGANGSGKSTWVKAVTGVYHPDPNGRAQIRVGDVACGDVANPTLAQKIGIRVVHQETPMIDTYSVMECVALFKGYPKKPSGLIDWAAARRYTEELVATYQLSIDPNMPTKDLTAAERNMMAMAIAIGTGEEMKAAKVLILDEADASVPEAEADEFLKNVRKIAEMGIPVCMVTHRLKAVRKFCDDVTVLNGGKVVYHGVMAETSDDFIISKMSPQKNILSAEEIKAGHARGESDFKELWKKLGKAPPERSDAPILRFENVKARDIDGLSFELYTGEILGFIGVSDSGIAQLPLVLGCDYRRTGGRYTLAGATVPLRSSPRFAYKNGLCLVPTDRPKRGGIMNLSLRDNLLLPDEGRYWHRKKFALEVVNTCSELLDINPRNGAGVEFSKFSG